MVDVLRERADRSEREPIAGSYDRAAWGCAFCGVDCGVDREITEIS